MSENQIATSTQIRNMYSEGISYLNISFFNTNLAFKLYPFMKKDNIGKSVYDMKNGQNTTVNFDGAYALYKTSNDIIDGNIHEVNLSIPCAAGATLTLERKLSQTGEMETILSLSKNNVIIPFKFKTINQQVKENGMIVTKVIESGLGVFMKTIEGYLTGINSDRHLDKFTDDYVKSKQSNQTNGQQYQNNYNGYNNQGNNGYKKQYQNKKQYQQQNWQQPNQQDISSYRIDN